MKLLRTFGAACAVAFALSSLGGCSKDPPAPAATATDTPAKTNPALLDPANAKLEAPALFKVKMVTSKGDVIFECHRDWSPKGADRFFNLVKLGYFDDTRFFRVVDGFMAQIGI